MLLVAGRPAEGGEHAADLVGRGHELVVAVNEGGAGNGEEGQGEHGKGDVAVPGLVALRPFPQAETPVTFGRPAQALEATARVTGGRVPERSSRVG